MKDLNLIMKTRFGSHLYGTDTPNSDTDYKGVYMATLEDVLLNKSKETQYFNTKSGGVDIKNSKNDIDFEVIELRKFIKDALAGQTYALDLLFTPLDFTESYSEIWAEVIKNRSKLLSKHMEPYIGYCRQQAAKYGLKGSRLGDVMSIIEYLNKLDSKMPLRDAMVDFKETDYIKIVDHEVRNQGVPKIEKWWEIVGKKFAMNTQIHYVIESETIFKNTYGARAVQAQENKGVDWKAVSHAFRCMYQLEEIADTGNLAFPLSKAEKLKNIKAGNVSYNIIQDELPILMERATDKVKKSKYLNDDPDYKFWDQFIINSYIK